MFFEDSIMAPKDRIPQGWESFQMLILAHNLIQLFLILSSIIIFIFHYFSDYLRTVCQDCSGFFCWGNYGIFGGDLVLTGVVLPTLQFRRDTVVLNAAEIPVKNKISFFSCVILDWSVITKI